MDFKISAENSKLVLFSFFITLVTYGFPLTNYSLSVDSETPIYSEFSMSLGRWGTNLVRYRIFEGHLPYYTMLVGIILLSLTAVELSKLFRFKGALSFAFCALFLTFPQMSYQLVFTMQADVVPLGFLLAVLAVKFFVNNSQNIFSKKSIVYFILSSLILMFVIAIYQALILIPIVVYIIILLQNTFNEDYHFKNEFKKGLFFSALLFVSLVFYYVSAKLLCPVPEKGLLSSYLAGKTDNQFLNACSIWLKNLTGNFYYGDKLFIIAFIVSIIMFIKFGIEKKHFLIRFICLFLMLILPFAFSFFITNVYHPPRIYLTSGLVFAFVIVYFVSTIKYEQFTILIISIICVANLYFITNLFYSNYKIFNHDKSEANKMNNLIQAKYPEFDENVNYVYFFGCLPYEHHQKYRIDKSEIFGGSLFNWDNGDNYRIINFFKFNDIAYYKMIDNRETYLKIKDSIAPMPVWPKKESVKMINNIIVVKLGNEKGMPLWVE